MNFFLVGKGMKREERIAILLHATIMGPGEEELATPGEFTAMGGKSEPMTLTPL